MDRFVVGSGRCGSTLLSRMLSLHPDALSVFECLNGLDVTRRFSPEPVSGEAFAALVCAEQPFLTAVLRRGYPVEEVIYPFGEGRYGRSDPLPYILGGMLPRMSDDPDALFDELGAFARSLPPDSAPNHWRRLFDWLAGKCGRRVWIEKSGSSIEYLESLATSFPGARFLHLHRDGHEVALSMREHHAYRLPIAVLYRAPIDGVPFEELPPLDLAAPPRPEDAISRILASRPPPEYFGRYWNDQILRGFRALRGLDAAQYREVPFEDLVARPEETLRAICAFFELESGRGDWLARAAAIVCGTPPTRFEKLPGEQRERLAEACRPGRALLGRAA